MKRLLLSLSACFFSTAALAEYFPDDNWELSSASKENVNELRLKALEDIAFKDPATQALVVVKNGKIISERYAKNYNQDSFGTSWSVAKSFYAALIGISIEKGEIEGSSLLSCPTEMLRHISSGVEQISFTPTPIDEKKFGHGDYLTPSYEACCNESPLPPGDLFVNAAYCLTVREDCKPRGRFSGWLPPRKRPAPLSRFPSAERHTRAWHRPPVQSRSLLERG